MNRDLERQKARNQWEKTKEYKILDRVFNVVYWITGSPFIAICGLGYAFTKIGEFVLTRYQRFFSFVFEGYYDWRHRQ